MSISTNMLHSEMTTPRTKRRYVLKERARRRDDTRRRIVESTVALHQEVGPAATHVSEIARRAGVQRVTVYNHFKDDESLFAACSAHWIGIHPAPDQEAWRTTADAADRLRMALRKLYAWYRETVPMTSNVLRDAETLPALRRVIESGLLPYLERVAVVLTEPYNARGKRRERVEAAARAAVDFHFWRALESLGDDAAAELGAGLVELAAA
jgi:AcrR family transcriptional regulator